MNLYVTSLKYSKKLKELGWNTKTKIIRINNKFCNFDENLWNKSTTLPAPDIGELLDKIPYLNNVNWINEKNRSDGLAKIWCERQEEIELEKKINAVKSIKCLFKLDKLNRKNTRKFLFIIAHDSVFWNVLTGKDLKDAIKREIYKNNNDYSFGYNITELLEHNSEHITFDKDKAIITENGIIKIANYVLQSLMNDYYEYNSHPMVLDITDVKHIQLIYPTKGNYDE